MKDGATVAPVNRLNMSLMHLSSLPSFWSFPIKVHSTIPNRTAVNIPIRIFCRTSCKVFMDSRSFFLSVSLLFHLLNFLLQKKSCSILKFQKRACRANYGNYAKDLNSLVGMKFVCLSEVLLVSQKWAMPPWGTQHVSNSPTYIELFTSMLSRTTTARAFS